jgi:hypothetical protein
LELFLVGVVLVLFGEGGLAGVVLLLFGGGLAGGAPGCNEELLLLDVPGSNESLLIPGDVSGVVSDLLFPKSRRSLLDPLVLDVLCDDEESTRRKSGDRAEEAKELGAEEGRVDLRSLRVVD